MFAKKILRVEVLKQIIDFELVLKALGVDYKEHKNYFSFRSLLRENKKRSYWDVEKKSYCGKCDF